MKIALRGFIPVFLVLFYSISIVSAETSETIPGEKNTSGNITSNIQENIAGIGGNNSINGHNLSNQSYDVRVALDHIFISKKNNSLEISEIVVFRNGGREIYYTKDNHAFFAISTPLDAKNLKTQWQSQAHTDDGARLRGPSCIPRDSVVCGCISDFISGYYYSAR